MSDDEDDLEVLRIAALATLKRKPEVQVPQGIPVVSCIQARITAADGDPQHNAVHGDHIYNEFSEQFVGEYDNVPIEVQRWFEQGPRGRGRGFNKGRGWHRGRGRGGYNNFPKLATSTSLIVLTTTAEEDNQPREKKDSPKPFLLRPQDKWASTDSGSSVSFSPPRTKAKDTSKFRRYDEDSDSEDDEDYGEREQEQQDSDGEPSHLDLDVDDHRTVVLKSVGEIHNSSTKANKYVLEISGELNCPIEEAVSNVEDVANISDLNISENVNQPETKYVDIQEQENSVLQENVSESDVDSEFEDKMLDTSNTNGHLNAVENNSGIADLQSDKNESDVDEKKSKTPEEKHVIFTEMENVSNSNSNVFSRFNRRPRRDSDSEIENSDNENNNASFDRAPSRPEITHSQTITVTRTSRSRSASSVGSRSQSPVLQTPSPSKTSPIHRQTLPSDNDKSSGDTFSESESDSDSSSSPSSKQSHKSLSPTRSPSQSPIRVSKSPHSHTRQVSPPFKTEQISSKCDKSRVSKSPPHRRRKSEHGKSVYTSQSYTDKSDVDYVERSVPANKNSGREVSRGRSWSPKQRRSASPKVSSEFDARNYRQVGMHTDSNSKEKATDNSDSTRRQYDKHKKHIQQRQMMLEEKEKRHFEEITRIKKEELRQKLSEVDSKLIEARRRKFDIAYAGSLKTKIEAQTTKNKVIEEDLQSEKIKGSRGDTYLKAKEDNKKEKLKLVKKSEEHKLDSKKLKKEKPKRETSRSRSPVKTPVKVEKASKSKRKTSHSSEKKKGSAKKKQKSHENKVSDSESSKGVSSLSDSESKSESETWRNKKVGASRKLDDIERERRQRKAQEREKNRTKAREESDKRSTFIGAQRHREQDRNRYDADRSDKLYRNRGRAFNPGRDYQDRYPKEKVYYRKNMAFYEEESEAKPKTFFEENNSDDESEVSSKRGVVSVVRNDKKGTFDKMVDLKISRTRQEPSEKSSKSKPSKKERLVIQVNTVGDEDTDVKHRKSVKRKDEKPKKKDKKKKEEMVDSDIEDSVKRHKKQVINVTFDQDDAGGSVHDRLGLAIKDRLKPDKGRSRHKGKSRETGEKREDDTEALSGGKRMKLTESGKYRVTDRLGRHGHKSSKESGSQDEGLSKKIRKIQEKNAEILRRRVEIEEDREQYG